MGNSKEFNKIRNERLQHIGKCELCGDTYGLELHHIIPRCCGGTDDEDNLVLVCGKCHARLTPRRILSKIGIDNCHLQDYFTSSLPVLFWGAIGDTLESGNIPNAADAIDIVCGILNEQAKKIKSSTISEVAKQTKQIAKEIYN